MQPDSIRLLSSRPFRPRGTATPHCHPYYLPLKQNKVTHQQSFRCLVMCLVLQKTLSQPLWYMTTEETPPVKDPSNYLASSFSLLAAPPAPQNAASAGGLSAQRIDLFSATLRTSCRSRSPLFTSEPRYFAITSNRSARANSVRAPNSRDGTYAHGSSATPRPSPSQRYVPTRYTPSKRIQDLHRASGQVHNEVRERCRHSDLPGVFAIGPVGFGWRPLWYGCISLGGHGQMRGSSRGWSARRRDLVSLSG